MGWRASAVILLGIGCGLAAGCSNGPASATVSGEVKVDGELVKKGIITFAPAAGAGDPVTAEIVNGKYEVRTTAGNKRVQISVPVVIEKRKDSAAVDASWVEMTKESLPDKYHSKSELTFDVKPGSNDKNWDVSVKK